MALVFTGTGGLFTRMGLILSALKSTNSYASATLPSFLTNIINQYVNIGSTSEPELVGPLQSSLSSIQNTMGVGGGLAQVLQNLATQTIIEMVSDDNAQVSRTIGPCLIEMISQMVSQGQTVQRCNVSAVPAAFISNKGNGTCVLSQKNIFGQIQENLFAESTRWTCTQDAQVSGTPGNELFQWSGDFAQTNTLQFDWPRGSGANASTVVCLATQNAQTNGNMLTNSDFEEFTSGLANFWIQVAGTAGTHSRQTTAAGTFLDGISALEFVGDGATNTAIRQEFNNATIGTSPKLLPNTVYAFNFWIRTSTATVPAGVLSVELVDQSGSVLADDQATSQASTFSLTSVGTTFVARNGFFVTPKQMPTTTSLRLRLSTALSAGRSLYLDRLAFNQMTRLYPGGPYGSVFAGITPFIATDYFTLTTANDRGGATFNGSFQPGFDRMFNMRGLGLLLPSNAVPTLPNSMIP